MRLNLCWLLSLLLISCSKERHHADWPEYLGGPDRNHYSKLDQINEENIHKLKLAWTYHSGDSGQMQCNPIIVDGIVYGMTASAEPFALHGKTGEELWRKREQGGVTWYGTSRGVAIWRGEHEKRLFYTRESLLIALDATTGKPINSFGDSSRVSLKAGLGGSAQDKSVISSTPGTIYGNLIIMPLRVSESYDAAPGYIQAFDVMTGKVAWVFKTIPGPGTEGAETWSSSIKGENLVGAANNWAGMAIDRARGILYVPTGSPAFDFHGEYRKGANLFANCLLALDARTGKKIWHYQLVHHDILDRDPPAPPNLITITRNGKKIDAVVQITKHGYVFVFNRETGEPLFDIEEKPVPASDVAGEEAWPTQPFPKIPAPFTRQFFSEEDINPESPNKDELLVRLRNSRSEGPFTPLSEKGTIIFPGLDGGAEWGGAAVDENGILYVNSNEMPWLLSLQREKSESEGALLQGMRIYDQKCSACHRPDRKGNAASGFPGLTNLKSKYHRDQTLNIITSGKGMMPAFKALSNDELQTLLDFLYDEESKQDKKEIVDLPKSGSATVKWRISGYTKFLDSNGNPAIKPPWGTLNAIDMNNGGFVWKKTFGDSIRGSESYGGPLVTASGLLFIAGTKDSMLRVYKTDTGKLLWQTKLPAAAFATPSTYAIDGKQYVVLPCGGTKLGAAKGESYVAFALE